MFKKKKLVKIGGANTYALKGTTLVEGYIPGPMRQNIRQNADSLIGKINFGTFGNDENLNGPGTLAQALPDASKYQYKQIFSPPRPPINKEFGIDDRQIAAYQVEQLHNNPLSQYTTNPMGEIPGFMCDSEPNNFSSMVNKRAEEMEEWTRNIKPNNYTDASQVPGRSAQNVYQQYTGEEVNPNLAVVYNMSLNSTEEYNPFISMGSSNQARMEAEFSGKCYSGKFFPGQRIYVDQEYNNPEVYGPNKEYQRTQMDVGFLGNNNTNRYCYPNPQLNFANPMLI